MKLKPELDAKGVKLIAIAGEHFGTEEFTPEYWKSDLYYDLQKKNLWPILDSGSTIVGGVVSYYTGGAVKQNLKRAADKGITGNMKGTQGHILGGVWVIGAGEQGLIFEHQETT
jgi:hypothetical protein